MRFRLRPLRFSFVAQDSIHFAEGHSANILRGAFGSIFRRMSCTPQCPGARECPDRATCPYARIFEPWAATSSPSGLADSPRPFVFRATHLDGCSFPSGERFHFDLNLFDTERAILNYFVQTFSELAREGLGRDRKKVELASVIQLDATGEPCGAPESCPPLEFCLKATEKRISRIHVQFLTPTELKSGEEIVPEPDFRVLATRLRDRVSVLRERYGEGPLAIDFRAYGENASSVRMTRCQIEAVASRRRSSRTGQTHPIGGFVGHAEYEGELTEFMPYLRLGRWTGVGRQTVWGKGQIAITEMP